MIDAIEAQGIPAVDVSPAYWRTAHNRYAANLEPAPYNVQSHAASRARRAIGSME